MALHAARVIRQRHKADSDSSPIENAADISSEQRKILEDAFEAADKNGDGILSAEEYYDIFQTHGLTIDKEWIERTIARNDKDGDGGISLDEFIQMNIKGRLRAAGTGSNGSSAAAAAATSITEKAKLAFKAYDRNSDGYLTKAELRRTSKKMTDAQIDAVFEKYDKNKDGKLEFEDFKDLMESNHRNKAAAAAATATVAAAIFKKGSSKAKSSSSSSSNLATAAAAATTTSAAKSARSTSPRPSVVSIPNSSSTSSAAAANANEED